MKKLLMALFLAFGFVGVVGVGSALAAHVSADFFGKYLISVTDPQVYQQSVYDHGTSMGPNFPPLYGGSQVILDITDRTTSQIEYLDVDLYGSPENGKRYELRFNQATRWIQWQLYTRGFFTTKWSEIRGCIWDKELKRTLASIESRYADPGSKLWDDCWLNCDYNACVQIGEYWSDPLVCDCEEYQGRTFCHKHNRFTYSDVLDY